jgi:hypothetical protein
MKLKKYRKLKVQRKISGNELLVAYRAITDHQERFMLLQSIISFDLFDINADFLIKTAKKEDDKYIPNGNYKKYKDDNFYTNGYSGYSTKYVGLLTGISDEIFRYKYKADSGEIFTNIYISSINRKKKS